MKIILNDSGTVDEYAFLLVRDDEPFGLGKDTTKFAELEDAVDVFDEFTYRALKGTSKWTIVPITRRVWRATWYHRFYRSRIRTAWELSSFRKLPTARGEILKKLREVVERLAVGTGADLVDYVRRADDEMNTKTRGDR